MRSDLPTKHSPIGRGYISYQQAKTWTLLGHKKEAVELLKRSRKEGRKVLISTYSLPMLSITQFFVL